MAVVAYVAIEMNTAVAAAAGDLVTAVGIALWKVAGEEEMNVACYDLYSRRVRYFGREFCMVAADCDRICSLRFEDKGIP